MKKLFVNIMCAFIANKKRRREIRRCLMGRPIMSQQVETQNPPVDNSSWLGRHSYHGWNFIRMNGHSTIGAFCSIGQNVAIGPSQHPTNWLSSAPFQYVKRLALTSKQKLYPYTNEPTFIGNDVWIGNNVVIKDGVKVGDGCIIGSNAVVTHDVPPYAIVAGVPARIIRYRFPAETIEKLLRLRWWDLPDSVIAGLPFNDIDACIVALEKIRKKTPVK